MIPVLATIHPDALKQLDRCAAILRRERGATLAGALQLLEWALDEQAKGRSVASVLDLPEEVRISRVRVG